MSTSYDGPDAISEFAYGGRVIRLVRPGDPDRLLDDPGVRALNRLDDYMPYWAYLWPGAMILADAIADEPWRAGLSALEIGCGLGLAGLVALSRGLRVRFTDYDEAALGYVARSVAANGWDASAFSTGQLDWRDPPRERFPVILGSDVLYERRLVPWVAHLLATMLEPGGIALIADPGRATAKGLAALLAPLGLTCASEPRIAEHGSASVSGTIYRIAWRG
jgi:predicted nicotinamide N-methyase